MLSLEFYLIFLASIMVGYFINEYSRSNFLLVLLFISSLIGFWLSVFHPIGIIQGYESEVISSTITTIKPIFLELDIITKIARVTFLMSTIVSVLIWTAGREMDEHKD